ncbi:MAG: MBL fold metallo-hydrolase [Candidatus Kerfeldbacteria bacterium]
MKRSIPSVTIIIVLVLSFVAYVRGQWVPATSDQLEIHMLDVGQGDAFHIRTPGGMDIVVDGGPDRSVVSELGRVMPPTDHTIELMIASHEDADHIAGLTELPDTYEIKTLITSGVASGTNFSDELATWASDGVEVLQAHQGWLLHVEEGLDLLFFHPDPPNFHPDINDDSVVFLLRYRDFSALFTGDAPVEIEEQVLGRFGDEIAEVDILKAGHHGSRTSTSRRLLEIMNSQITLISVGKDNTFGHPHAEVVRRLESFGSAVFRTDEDGPVTCLTNGSDFSCFPR